MKTPDSLNDVAAFHRTFHLPVLETPQLPPPERAALRVNLLREELQEFEEAIAAGDLVEAADALCDLQYVLAGAVLEFGLGDKFAALFAEVQRSNMSKTCADEAEAAATAAHYAERAQAGRIEPNGDHFLVYRNDDGKVLKSINYSPADLRSIL
ncbi:MAG: nucleoside triphosphate pyrophosphohydrolase family protein [Saprospiraceae bacterium]